jgi:hypothetical protein
MSERISMSQENTGNIESPQFGELVVACVVCKERKPVLLYPHKLDGRIVGWVFVCVDDQMTIRGADVQIQFAQQGATNER